MRKKIAIFLGEIGREFQKEFSMHMRKLANSQGYDVFIFNNFGSYTTTYLYDSGERDVINIPVFSDFSGVISLADTFDIDGMENMLIDKIRKESDCPIISVRNGAEGTYRILFDDYRTTYEITNHFIKHHGFTKLGFMSGPFSATDSEERLRGFKDAVTEAGITFSETMVFEGDFWKFLSKPAAEHFLSLYDGNIEAVICANDYMAIGLCEELKNRGKKIPEDIAISGFDEVIEGRGYIPILTTVEMPIAEMASRAMEIIVNVNNGVEESKENLIAGNVLLKASCGCHPDTPSIDISFLFNQISDDYINLRNGTAIISDLQNTISEREKLEYISTYTDIFNFGRVYVCLCTDNYKDDNPYSDTMTLRAVLPLTNEINNTSLINKQFSRNTILPEELFENSEPSCYVVLPIHHKNTTYGYMVTDADEFKYTVYLAPYREALAIAYEDLRLQEQFGELTEIKRQNLIDPLTGIYNRRGFEQSLASLTRDFELGYDIVSFISIDLDNLKPINDNYGHQEGDIAIKTVADVLTYVLGDDGICSRVGGDEFYALLTTSDLSKHESFIDRVNALLQVKNDELNKPYKIHASIGMCSSPDEQYEDTFTYIQVADKRMYEAKREYKNS